MALHISKLAQGGASIENWTGLNHMALLNYLRIKGCRALVSFSPESRAEQLQVLDVSESGLTQIQLDSKCLSRLQRLTLDYCPYLESLLPGCTSLGSVRHLSIRECRRLGELLIGVQCATALQHLSIEECPALVSFSTRLTAEQLEVLHI